MTLVSIVTPTLNAERYLTDCLDSVRAQNWPTLEHLVVDGGSRDRTYEIVKASGARWISRPGLGQSAAINAGLREARGDIVAWLNADDLYLPAALSRVNDEFETDPGLDVVYGDCDVIGSVGETLWCERPGRYDYTRLLRRGNYLAQPAVFFRRRLFEDIGYLNEHLNYAMDFELWLRLSDRRLNYVPYPLAAFRWHSRSKTASSNLANWSEFLTIVRMYGGGWTPPLVWSFVRARFTTARHRTLRLLQSH